MTRAGGPTIGATEESAVAVIGNEVLDLDVPTRADAVAGVRHAVVDHLLAHGVPSMVVDDAELVVSELVTNAIIHPRPSGPPWVHVHVEVGEHVEISVANNGSAAEIPPVDEWLPAPAVARSGRGLAIVRRLCDAVTIQQSGEHAVVTCRRRLPDGGTKP